MCCVSGGALNSTHSLTRCLVARLCLWSNSHRVRIRFSVQLVSGYHVVLDSQLSVVIEQHPTNADTGLRSAV